MKMDTRNQALRIVFSLCFAVLLTTTFSSCRRAGGAAATGITQATQPAQPASGPGGSDYKYADMVMSHFGTGNEEYWIFEPSGPKPESAPVVVFMHGWGGMNPKYYGAWIRHIVRRGNIVIYPRYQASLRTNPTEMTPAAVAAIKDALNQLNSGKHVKPDTERFALVGHSLGGMLSASITAIAEAQGLPKVRAFMPTAPGDSKGSKVSKLTGRGDSAPSVMADFSAIPKDTLIFCVVGDDDQMVGSTGAKIVFNGATAVPAENKDFITVHSDNHGTPALDAGHSFPGALDESMNVETDSKPAGPIRQRIRERMRERMDAKGSDQDNGNTRGAVDTLDYYGTWRLFDMLTDCAFYQKACDSIRPDSPELRNMGKWSDGTPVKELTVTNSPDQI